MPNTTYSSSISLISLTGVAARRVGVYAGAFPVVTAFFPKMPTLLLAIPGPVVGAHVTTFLALVFIEGLKAVIRDGIDPQKTLIAGMAFWIGVGFEYKMIFPYLLGGSWGTLLGIGMVVGGVVAVVLTQFVGLTSRRRRNIRVDLSQSSMPEIYKFLSTFAHRMAWNETSTDRLRAAGEETLTSLLQDAEESSSDRLLEIGALAVDGAAELEFTAVSGEENMEDRLAYLPEQPEI